MIINHKTFLFMVLMICFLSLNTACCKHHQGSINPQSLESFKYIPGEEKDNLGIYFKTFNVPQFEANNYIIACKQTGQAALIDISGYDLTPVEAYLKEHNLGLRYVFLTHGHHDHILGLNKLNKLNNVKIIMSEKDKFLVDKLPEILNSTNDSNLLPLKNFVYVKDEDNLNVGSIKIKVLETPGHTPGGLSFYIPQEKIIFTGDTLFDGNYGRTDLEGGSEDEIKRSLNKLFKLPGQTTVFSGHGPNSTIQKDSQSLQKQIQ